MQCETCAYYMYDEEEDEYFCEADMDQDDIYMTAGENCRYWRNGDEYTVVRHQM